MMKEIYPADNSCVMCGQEITEDRQVCAGCEYRVMNHLPPLTGRYLEAPAAPAPPRKRWRERLAMLAFPHQ